MQPLNVPEWRLLQRKNFTSVEKIAQFLELNEELTSKLLPSPAFPINVPLRLAEKMRKNDLGCPIVRQFIPLLEEVSQHEGFQLDPVEDKSYVVEGSLLQKYASRALVVTTGACAMNCRFCFRQNFDYGQKSSRFEKELIRIRRDDSLREIILSGGDPLSLGDAELGALLDELEKIEHVERIRFHTRFVVGIPERIDDSFVKLLERKKQIIFIVHINHQNELDEELFFRLRRLQALGIPVLSQTVLLQGVNDSVEALEKLFFALVNRGIMPYYLHQLDRVRGAYHFEVPKEKGLSLIHELEKRLPGYAVPRYVQEISGKPNKVSLTSFQEC